MIVRIGTIHIDAVDAVTLGRLIDTFAEVADIEVNAVIEDELSLLLFTVNVPDD